MNGSLSDLQSQFIKQLSDPATIFLDPDGRIAGWNERAGALFGERIESARGEPLKTLFKDIDPAQEALREELLRAGKKPVVFYRQWEIGGRSRRGKLLLRAVPADSGTLLGYGIIFIDLDEANEDFHLKETASPESRAIAEIKDYAIFFVDAEGIIQSWNEGTQAIKGYSREEFVGHPFSMLFTPKIRRAAAPPKN